jgi:ribosomal protein S18 acetylase RimI-like enzyme
VRTFSGRTCRRTAASCSDLIVVSSHGHHHMRIEPVDPRERAHLLEVAVGTGLFTPQEAESLLGDVLDGISSAGMQAGHEAACCRSEENGVALGWCYFAPDDHAQGIWNLWWIGVAPDHHGCGVGKALLKHAERRAVTQGGRILIIETSDSDRLSRARRFYASNGYTECGRIPHFYSEDESKVIFSRRLEGSA